MVARIDPDWIEPMAEHLVRRSYSEPHWSKKRQSATAFEKVSLFGLPIVAQRPVRYGPIDPDHSRQLLIEKGLVENQMRIDPAFLVHNRGVLQEIESLAAKTRQRDFVIDDYAIRNFYDSRLPAEAVDGATLAGLLKKNPELRQRLQFTVNDLLNSESAGPESDAFPDHMEFGDLRLPVEYNFTPGTVDDGVNIRVPVEAVAQIHENHLGWSVPGLLETRIVALIRSLPKAIRRNLVPAPETAQRVAAEIEFGVGSFFQVISERLSRVASEPITAEMFNLDKLDNALKVNLQACDESGQVIAQGRSLFDLKTQLPQSTAAAAVQLPGDGTWHRDDLREWIWDDLPEQIVVRRGAADVPLFPTIVDGGDHVQLRLLDHRGSSRRSTRQGLATLYRIAHRKLIRSQVKWLPLDPLLRAAFERTLNGYRLHSVADKSTDPYDLDHQLAQLIALSAFVDGQSTPRTLEEFLSRNSDAAERIGLATQKMAGWLPPLLQASHNVSLQLQQLPRQYSHALEDIQRQLQFLFGEGALSDVAAGWLGHLPRYLNAISARLDRLQSGALDKDRQQTVEIHRFVEQYEQARQLLQQTGGTDDELEYFGWMIQEFRVSLFAQQLGTSETVSPQRLEKQWKKVDVRR
jgi:ATP-dependent helicase HrpA